MESPTGPEGHFGGDCGQSSGSGLGEEFGDGVLALVVGFEGPLDEGYAVGVDLDGAVLPTLVVAFSDVEVADGCAGWGAACGDFLGHAFGDFRGEVAGVELRNARHDAVEQHAGGVSSMFSVAETSRTPTLMKWRWMSTSLRRLRASRSTLCTMQ